MHSLQQCRHQTVVNDECSEAGATSWNCATFHPAALYFSHVSYVGCSYIDSCLHYFSYVSSMLFLIFLLFFQLAPYCSYFCSFPANL